MRPAISDAAAEFTAEVTYLNSASVSLMPSRCISAMADFLHEYNAAGPDSPASDDLVQEAARRIRRIISAMLRCQPNEIALTQSTTDGINLVASGLHLQNSSNIILRSIQHEHHANVYPWLRLPAATITLDTDMCGFFDVGNLESMLDANTALVALSHGLYNTGALLDLERVGRLLRGAIPFFVDAAQTVGCVGDYDFSRLQCDFMAFNGSKWLCGPMGTGLFYCSRQASNTLEPAFVGGESAIMYDGGRLAHMDMPNRFQAGYRNYAGLAGLAASLEYVSGLGLDAIAHHNARLCDALREGLASMQNVHLYGPPAGQRIGIVSFVMENRKSADVVRHLGARGIVVALREINDTKIVRVSPHFYNTISQIETLLEALRRL